jgi:PAS domain S-box-containing protein
VSESDVKWQSIFKNCPDIIICIDRDGRVLFINHTISGVPVEEVVGKKLYDFMSPENAKKAREAIEATFRTGKVSRYEIQHRKPEGEIMWLDARVGPNVYKDAIHSATIVTTDVTDHRRAEEAKVETEKKYRLIFENAKEGIVVLNTRGKVLEANPKAMEISGLKREEILGRNFVELLPLVKMDIKTVLSSFKDLVRGKDFRNREWTLTNRKGKRITFLARPSFVRRNGKIIGFSVVLEDVSERKLAEKMLEEQKMVLEQKNIALREIVAQIEVEKNRIKEDVSANVDEILMPILKKLRIKGDSRKYVDLLRRNLEDLASSFGRKISDKRFKLTPREIEICDMIKEGLTSKEISGILGVSCQTIEKHRKNIREKLRISNKNINLTTFLQQL